MVKLKISFFIFFLAAVNAYSQPFPSPANKTRTEDVNVNSPDYSNLFYWASHPFKRDPADSIPSFLRNDKSDSFAHVFFIHPTTFTKGFMTTTWNADVNDDELNELTDNKTIFLQGSIFNGSCRVFAPRYRQAHLKSFFAKNDNAANALDLAYTDVKKAFAYYLAHENNGRPIVIAGHSQGAFHAIRLLKEYFDAKPLQQQLVCAYVVGWPIKKDEFKSLPFGTKPLQTGCVLGWRSYRYGSIDKLVKTEEGNSQCINPITWTVTETLSEKRIHKGMVGKDFDRLHAQMITASVEPTAKILWVNLPPALDESKGFMNNFHIADFNLFYMDVRENVKQRIGAFLHK